MKKRFLAGLTALLLLTAFCAYAEKTGEASRDDGPDISVPAAAAGVKGLTLDDLDGKRIGVLTGTISGQLAEARLPNAEVIYYNTQTDSLTALETGKIDAWTTDQPVLRFMRIEHPELEILDEYMAESNLAAVFPKTEKGQALCGQFSEFLERLWADGTMAEIDAIWFGEDDSKRTVADYEHLPAPNGTLLMAADLTQPPFTYVVDRRAVGYDVDVAARFCQEYGYGLKVDSMSFDGVLASVQAGKCDFACSCITVTEERAESVLFSIPDYYGGIATAVLANHAAEALPGSEYTSLSQLNGKSIGVQTGTNFAEMVEKVLPDATIETYNTKADLVAALTGRKVDAFVVDEPVAQLLLREIDRLTYLPEYLDNYVFAFVFAKNETGEALRDQFNSFLRQLPDGTLDSLAAKWFGDGEDAKVMPDISALPAKNGTLRVATESGYAPFEYVRDGRVVGYDMDLAALFCEACGYGLEIVDMNFDGILPSVQTAKCDFAAAGISITPERAESVLFSEPTFSGGTVAVVLKAEAAGASPAADPHGETFRDGIISSFSKTFLREGRWRLFLEGIGNTMLITLFSILFGTALGFLIFMLCRNGNVAANSITRFSLWLVQGTPMVVLLMILYYVIFGSVAISGIIVSVIGFTLTFGAAVYGLIRMGVGTIDPGQYEAAYALGHSNRHTFFKIILPQAIPHVLPAYQGEIVGLIKATSIVGYIAVQDLTKMGDIVRSRTYEAFFPLIAVTVIYFLLEGLLSFAVGRIRISIDPRKRSRDRILKGVKIHD